MLARFSVMVLLASALVATVGIQRTWAADEKAPESAAHGGGAAHGEHGHDHIGLADPGPMVEKPQEFKSDLALWTLVVFLLLLAILWKFAWGPIVASLERREQTIANHIAEVERNHLEAKAMLAQYELKLAGAANEVRALMEEARRDAEHTKQDILTEAKAGAEAERVRALRDIDAAADAAMESLAKRSAQLAVDLAGKILQQKLDSGEHARLIEDAMSKFPAASKN